MSDTSKLNIETVNGGAVKLKNGGVYFHVTNLRPTDEVSVNAEPTLVHVVIGGVHMSMSRENWRVVLDAIDDAVGWRFTRVS